MKNTVKLDSKTASAARQKLLNFFDEIEKSDMAKNSISQIRFALMFAYDNQIDQFVEWLFEDGETPEPKALEALNTGKYNYLENFGHISPNDFETIKVTIQYEADEERNINFEDHIVTEIDKQEPFGLDANSTCIYRSNNTYYVTTDFMENGEPDKNPTIAVVTLDLIRK